MKLRINKKYIEFKELPTHHKQVYLVGQDGHRYSRADIAYLCGISERWQRDLIETNKPGKKGLCFWRAGRFMKLAETLGVSAEELINAEDFSKLKAEVNEAAEKARKEGHQRKAR